MTHDTLTQTPDAYAVAAQAETRPNLPLKLGTISLTDGAKQLAMSDIISAVARHRMGDWGTLCEQDRDANNDALAHEGSILSVYAAGDGTEFWVITDCLRTFTTVLLPMEY